MVRENEERWGDEERYPPILLLCLARLARESIVDCKPD